jgi:kynurenine formamidase
MTLAIDPTTKTPYTIAKDGFHATYYEMVGPIRNPCRSAGAFFRDRITMDQIPLKQIILPLIVLDNTLYLAKDPNHAFSLDDLRAWEKKHGRVAKGSFVALRTDMYKDWDNSEKFKRHPFSAWSFETIKFLTKSAAG